MQGQQINGVIAVYKPAGMVSKDVSRRLERSSPGKLKLGHVGTLDPAADGVLPLVCGKATRLQDLLLDLPKSYLCEVRLGQETDTLDLDGVVVREAAWEQVTWQALQQAAATLEGAVVQTPPLYSAVKYKGLPLYAYARRGRSAEIDFSALQRTVFVSSCKVLAYDQGVFTLAVDCSKGTYIRVIAQQIAEAVGSCATVTRLTRTQAAGILLAQACSLEALEAAFALGTSEAVRPFLLPMEGLALGLPVLRVREQEKLQALAMGKAIDFWQARFNDDPYKQGIPPGLQRQILLLDDSGQAFGLGSGKWLSADCVQVGLKRSLRS